MASMTVEQAALRCAAAGDMQELAVFVPGDRDGEVLVVFERTVETQRWIRAGKPRLIGIYAGDSTYFEVTRELRKCLRS